MPRVPGAVNVNLPAPLGVRLLRQGRQELDRLFEARLAVHGNVDDEVEARSNVHGLQHRAAVLGDALVSAIPGGVSPRARDDDAPDSAEVGIGNLEVENLPRDTGDDGVGRGQVNPGAGVGDVSGDCVTGEERGVLGGQRGDNSIRQRDGILLRLCEVLGDEVLHTRMEVLVGDGCCHEVDLMLGVGCSVRGGGVTRERTTSLTPAFRSWPYWRSSRGWSLSESCWPMLKIGRIWLKLLPSIMVDLDSMRAAW